MISTRSAGTPVSSHSSRSAAARGASPGSTPPCGTVDPVIATAFEASLKILEALGATLVPFDLPDADRLADVFEKHWFTGAANRLTAVPADRRGEVDPGFLEVAAAGAAMGAVDLVAAQVARAGFGATMDERLAELDFVVSPATRMFSPPSPSAPRC